MNKKSDKLFDLLSIALDSSKEKIKKAFREKAKKMHPDKGGNQEDFNQIVKAYEILSDDEKKDNYDKGIKEGITLEDEATQVLLKIFEEIISLKIQDDYLSVKESLEDTINRSIKKVDNDYLSLYKKIKRLEEIKDKVSSKGINLYQNMIEQHIRGYEVTLKNISRQKDVLQEALKISKDYKDVGLKKRPEEDNGYFKVRPYSRSIFDGNSTNTTGGFW